MKKFLSLVMLVAILITALTVFAFAKTLPVDSFVGENEFSLASYHGTTNYIAKLKNLNDLEDACFWMADNKTAFNLKFVTFLGKLTGGSEHTYYNTVNQGMELNAFLELFNSDEEAWANEFKVLGDTTSILKEEGIPMAFVPAMADFYGGGYNRNSYFSEYLATEAVTVEGVTVSSFDEYNSYTVIENNGVKYMIFQLEVYPRRATLE